ncbi:MAG: HAMP domain-containing protein [Deltaproteobacteria bacterium]|nr:HAMP domain-containing protein [Deltaproteobacteria bacterium]
MELLETITKMKSRRLSIKVYLILINVILLCLLFPAAGFHFMQESAQFRDLQLQRTISQMHDSLERRAVTLARNLSLSAGEAVAGFDFSLLSNMASQMVENDPEILYFLIADRNENVVVRKESKDLAKCPDVEKKITDEPSGGEFPDYLPKEQPVSYRIRKNPKVLEVIVPVYSGGQLWGSMRCGHSLDKLDQEIGFVRQEWASRMQQFKFYLYSTMALFFMLGTGVALFATRYLVRSIDALNAGVKQVAEGDLEHEIHVGRLACDEFFTLSRAFNSMTRKLRDSYHQLQDYSRSLEDKVAARTRDLEQAQASLVQQAHEAGMAEMAVGVLHNIGNAITPANIGLSLLIKKLGESPLRTGLTAALAPLGQVINRDSALSADEKKRYAGIITLLPESIRQEYDQSIEEIKKVKDKHEHVESIIALQMRYARLVGNFAEISFNQLVTDALQMLEDSMMKRQVRVTTDLGQLPLIRAEEPKLLQILINIIKNGFEAMEETPPENRRLAITTAFQPGNPGQVMCRVKDSGCGFKAEDREKLFTFGFTTKAKGSGFGLHSCANYIIANQGTIEAKSDGPGQGAEFVVRLPLDPGLKGKDHAGG